MDSSLSASESPSLPASPAVSTVGHVYDAGECKQLLDTLRGSADHLLDVINV